MRRHISKYRGFNFFNIAFQCDHGCVDRLPVLSPADLKVVMANYSLKRDPYESTYDDFMGVWLQFGHVFLFSSVYPLAGFFALMNNIFEIKVRTSLSPPNFGIQYFE